jgi:hypothetical protein
VTLAKSTPRAKILIGFSPLSTLINLKYSQGFIDSQSIHNRVPFRSFGEGGIARVVITFILGWLSVSQQSRDKKRKFWEIALEDIEDILGKFDIQIAARANLFFRLRMESLMLFFASDTTRPVIESFGKLTR